MATNQFGFDTVNLPESAVRTRELRDCIVDALERDGFSSLSLAMQTAILRGMEILGELEDRIARLEDDEAPSAG